MGKSKSKRRARRTVNEDVLLCSNQIRKLGDLIARRKLAAEVTFLRNQLVVHRNALRGFHFFKTLKAVVNGARVIVAILGSTGDKGLPALEEIRVHITDWLRVLPSSQLKKATTAQICANASFEVLETFVKIVEQKTRRCHLQALIFGRQAMGYFQMGHQVRFLLTTTAVVAQVDVYLREILKAVQNLSLIVHNIVNK